MTPKIVLTTTGIIMLLHGILFFFGADEMARSGVPDIGEKALRVGIGLAEIVAITSFFLGIVLIFSRDIKISSAKKVLTGTGIGYLFLIAGVIKHVIDFQDIPEQAPPIPMLVIIVLLAVWSFYVALIKKHSNEEN